MKRAVRTSVLLLTLTGAGCGRDALDVETSGGVGIGGTGGERSGAGGGGVSSVPPSSVPPMVAPSPTPAPPPARDAGAMSRVPDAAPLPQPPTPLPPLPPLPVPLPGRDAGVAAMCHVLRLEGPTVTPELSPGPRPRDLQAQGGRLVDGLYVLTQVRIFDARGPEALVYNQLRLRMSVRISREGMMLETATAASFAGFPGAEQRESATLQTLGNALMVNRICPTRDLQRIAYTFTGRQLILFLTDQVPGVYVFQTL